MTATLVVIGLAVVFALLLARTLRSRKPKGDGWIPATEIIAREAGGRHRLERRKGIRMEECPSCGESVITVRLKNSEQSIVLDSTPDQARGTVIVLGGECRYLDGPQDYAAVRANGFPVYRRHNTRCTGFWRGQRTHNYDPHDGTETR